MENGCMNMVERVSITMKTKTSLAIIVSLAIQNTIYFSSLATNVTSYIA